MTGSACQNVSLSRSWTTRVGIFFIFILIPVIVAPQFLDYAQEAKTTSLVIGISFLLFAFSARIDEFMGALGKLRSLPRLFWFSLLGLLLSSFVSLRGSSDLLVSYHALRNLIFPILAAMLTSVFLCRHAVLTHLSLSSTLIACLGLCQIAFNIKYLTPMSDSGQFPGVTFGNRGLATTFVALGFIPTLSMLRTRTGNIKYVLAAGIFFQGSFLFAAMTRSSILACVLATWIWQRLDSRGRGTPHQESTQSQTRHLVKPMLLCASLLACVVVCVYANSTLRILLEQRLNIRTWLANPRLELWSSCLKGFASADIWSQSFGFGPGQFLPQSEPWLVGTSLAGRVFADAHNDYLQILVEYGALGLLFHLLMISVCLSKISSASTQDETRFIYLGNAVLILLAACFFYPFNIPFLSFLFWIMLLTPLVSPASETSLEKYSKVWSKGSRRFIQLALISLSLMLANEAWNRMLLEANMRAYLYGRDSSIQKMVTRKALLKQMRTIPVPFLYRKFVKK